MRNKFKNNIIAALDIGSSKIICLIAELREDNSLKVRGVGHNFSQGFKGTIITDIKSAESSVISAIYEAERMAGLSIETVLLSISGSAIGEEDLEIESLVDEQVSSKNLKDLLAKTVNSFDTKNREILHFFPLDFGLDGTYGIKDPVSMYGYSLHVRAKIVYLPSSHVINLVSCLEKCRLHISNMMISGYAAAFSCLSEEEKEQGVTLVDIGANTTSIVVFYGKNIITCSNLPIGGNHITSDISYGLAIDFATAEKIKILEGNAFLTSFDEGSMIEIDSNNADEGKTYISKAELSMIIRARLEEIIEMIKGKVDELKMGGLSSKKIVLTGGVTNLIGLKEIASNIFGNPVKIAIPRSIEGMGRFNSRSDFASAIGILYFIAENHDKSFKPNKKSFKLPANNSLGKVVKWLKENL